MSYCKYSITSRNFHSFYIPDNLRSGQTTIISHITVLLLCILWSSILCGERMIVALRPLVFCKSVFTCTCNQISQLLWMLIIVIYPMLGFTLVSLSNTCAAVIRLDGSNWSICLIMFFVSVTAVVSDGLSIRGALMVQFFDNSIIALARLWPCSVEKEIKYFS